jgi:hypothetical protein
VGVPMPWTVPPGAAPGDEWLRSQSAAKPKLGRSAPQRRKSGPCQLCHKPACSPVGLPGRGGRVTGSPGLGMCRFPGTHPSQPSRNVAGATPGGVPLRLSRRIGLLRSIRAAMVALFLLISHILRAIVTLID